MTVSGGLGSTLRTGRHCFVSEMVWHIYRELSLFTALHRRRIVVYAFVGRAVCLSVSLSFWRSSILKFVFGTRLPAQLSHSLAPYEMANLFWRRCLNFFSPRNSQQVNTSDEESHLSVPLNVFGGWLISPWTTVELSYRCPSSTRLDWKG